MLFGKDTYINSSSIASLPAIQRHKKRNDKQSSSTLDDQDIRDAIRERDSFDDDPVKIPEKEEEDHGNIPCKKCGPSYQNASLLKLPLAVATIVFGLYFLTSGVWNFISAYTGEEPLAFSMDILADTIFACLDMMSGLACLYGVARRSAVALNLFLIGYNVTIVNSIIDFVVTWFEWLMMMAGVTDTGIKWIPNAQDLLYMSYYSGRIIAVIFWSFFAVFGTINSLKAVFAAGGHGFEKKSYVDFIADTEKAAVEKAKTRLRNNPDMLKELLEATSWMFQTNVKKGNNVVYHSSRDLGYESKQGSLEESIFKHASDSVKAQWVNTATLSV